MSTTIKLPDEIIFQAKQYAPINSRSIPKQLSHWAKIGKIAEENPDLSYHFIKDILYGLQEYKHNEVSNYEFG